MRLPVYCYFGKTANKVNALTDERNKYKYADIMSGANQRLILSGHQPHFCIKKEATKSDFFWRRKRDLNPRAGFPTYSLSRGAPSPLGYFCMAN